MRDDDAAELHPTAPEQVRSCVACIVVIVLVVFIVLTLWRLLT